MTNANRSVSSVNDRLFPVELTEIADWKYMSEYMLHSNFGKALAGYRREFWCIYLYIAASLFPKYLSIFLDVLLVERYLNKIKILRNFREKTHVVSDKPTRVVLFEFSQRSSAKCRG